MVELVKLLVIGGVIIFLLAKKWPLRYIILLSSLLVGALFALSPLQIVETFIFALIDPATLRLLGIVGLVYILSGLLNKVEILGELVDSLRGLIKDYRLTLAFIPALLGLIPMPAGTMFSAPLVKEVGRPVGLTPEEATFANYWFRHVWEFVWPLFPDLILFAGLLGVKIQEIIWVQLPLALTAIVVGLVWEYKNLKKDNTVIHQRDIFPNLKRLFLGIWPILLIIILVLGIKIEVLISLVIVILAVFFLNLPKLTAKTIKEIIRDNLDWKVLTLVASIMIFQRMLQVSGGIEIIPEVLAKWGAPIFIVLFIIPFVLGIMTGMGTAALGISVPLLLPIIIPDEINLSYAMLVFAGSYTGMMISPMHLCLVVSKDYFRADMGKIYRMLSFPLIVVVLVAFGLVMVKS